MGYPTSDEYSFEAGNNLAAYGVYTTELLQLVRECSPNAKRGLVWYDSVQPDLTGWKAWNVRNIWLDISTTPPTPKIYNNSTHQWVNMLTAIPAVTVTNAMIVDNTIKLIKLALDGTAGQIPRINTLGNAWEFVNPTDLFANGDLNIRRLAVPGWVNSGLLVISAGIITWIKFSDLGAWLADGTIQPTTLVSPGVLAATYRFLTSDPNGVNAWTSFDPITMLTNSTIPLVKLQAGTNGQVPTIVGGVPVWATPAVPKLTLEFTSSDTAIPAANGSITPIPHGLAVIPKLLKSILKCTSNDAAVHATAGDQYNAETLMTLGGGSILPVFAIWADNTNIYCRRVNATAINMIDNTLPHNYSGVIVTEANWRLSFTAWA